MATFDQFRPARPAPAFGFISNVLGMLIAWNDRRVTLKLLNGLTERELNDIGLERADLVNWSRR
ncbi:DUF1127 domain-containing protein [Jannaschia sp. S6380]|uniref:DUF1127 domain-containing protein n=1 Tax=Jannaschia sp. S6380 TaxID=2926408 RepID=UPI001FF57126|nr:DUF1127 domain-containing protein [Jannaschia sp. S6380]MCK0169263.1 DUF1127 domain-containing protein [Jannaschia sp. S6380]